MHHRVESIDWYCELQGRGPTVVLIPSGEGDCGSFARIAELLSSQFTVLTFDMPGFSRSSDPPNFENYSMSQAAGEVASLVRSLDLGPATFYGCSSGGLVGLCLAVEQEDVVRNVAVHEVPLPSKGSGGRSPLGHLVTLDDDDVVRVCRDLFRNEMNEDPAAWDALGVAYHERLARNYVTWVRRYVASPGISRAFAPEDLHGRPIAWTIGGMTPAFVFFSNVVLAHSAGIRVGLLMCKHFPQVSIPDVLADHIRKVALG